MPVSELNRAACEVAAGQTPEHDEYAAQLVRGLRARDERAAAAFFDRYVEMVERSVVRVLGRGPEVQDVVQATFIAAFRTLHQLRDPPALPVWLRRIAVGNAIDHLRSRRRRRWLSIFDPKELPEPSSQGPSPYVQEAVEATYDVLGKMSVQERTAFALRFIEGLEIAEVASACNVSVATAKRRIAVASARFRKLAVLHPSLKQLLTEGSAPDGRP
jgi:RNA polymerase sigma-70 factor (ECF subfamily)